MINKTTHDAQQFFMPAEWHPHSRCWLGWPCRPDTWDNNGLTAARRAYAAVAAAIARFEPVTMLARPEDAAEAQDLCGPAVDVLPLPLSDSWLRDTGPTFVIDRTGRVAGIDWQFNAWGGNYGEFSADAALARTLLTQLNLPAITAPLVLEGGSVHVDGEGTLLTTEQCLLNPNRNPGYSREELEALLRHYLGVDKVLWLGNGLADDETDGHIDNLACFAKPGVVLLQSCPDPDDANHAPYRAAVERLRGFTDAKGRRLEIVEIEQPTARQRPDGRRLAQSYINFYFANNGLVMPSFADPAHDAAAKATLQRLYPEREIVQVPALSIVHGGGGIHCITQQQPAPYRL